MHILNDNTEVFLPNTFVGISHNISSDYVNEKDPVSLVIIAYLSVFIDNLLQGKKPLRTNEQQLFLLQQTIP